MISTSILWSEHQISPNYDLNSKFLQIMISTANTNTDSITCGGIKRPFPSNNKISLTKAAAKSFNWKLFSLVLCLGWHLFCAKDDIYSGLSFLRKEEKKYLEMYMPPRMPHSPPRRTGTYQTMKNNWTKLNSSSNEHLPPTKRLSSESLQIPCLEALLSNMTIRNAPKLIGNQ